MPARPWLRFYEDGVPPSLDYVSRPLGNLLVSAAERFPNRTAIVFQNGRLTYRELAGEADRLAAAMSALGVGYGDRVAIQAPNLPQTMIAFFAVMRLGAIAVMTNPLYTAREIEHQWNDAGVRLAVVMDFIFADRIAAIRERLRVEHYLVASIPEYLAAPIRWIAPFKLKRTTPPMIATVVESDTVHHFRDLIRSSNAPLAAAEVQMDDVALLQYTGGTTGVSKGAMLTHRNVMANVQQTSTWNTRMEEGGEVCIGALPLFHIYGLTIVMLVGVHMGATIVLVPNPRDIPGLIRSTVRHRATLLPAVPAMFQGINQMPGIDTADLSSVRTCNSGSAPLPVEVLERFETLTGARICEGYGLSETSPVTHSNPFFGTRKVGSIGLPLPDTDTRIVDLEDGVTDQPIGEEGELLLRGPQVFGGYWNKAEETAAAIRDGWFYTGDIARMDADGFHYIVGRKKDMILCSGYNVYPDEIDRVLMAHPSVLEAATIGIPDERRGETVKSFVVKRPGEHVSVEELDVYCRENLAAYKVPRAFEFRDALPKSTVLKVLRRELREEELAKRASSDS